MLKTFRTLNQVLVLRTGLWGNRVGRRERVDWGGRKRQTRGRGRKGKTPGRGSREGEREPQV